MDNRNRLELYLKRRDVVEDKTDGESITQKLFQKKGCLLGVKKIKDVRGLINMINSNT